LYGCPASIHERHRHRYEVNPQYVKQFQEKGLLFIGHDEKGERMEILELRDHPYFVATQYHPEYKTRPLRPTPIFLGFILAAAGELRSYIEEIEGKVQPGSSINGVRKYSTSYETPVKTGGLVNGVNNHKS